MGIRKVFNIQRSRYFPMPDYDFGTAQKVAVTVYGKVLDENYSRLLFGREDISLETVFLLDRVQKKMSLERGQYTALRKHGFIEGKAPNVYVSAKIAEIIGEQAQYTKNRAMDNQYYMDLIIRYLEKFGQGTKADFLKLLADKFSDVLDAKQKDNKVRSLLNAMHSKYHLIERTKESKRSGAWLLAEKNAGSGSAANPTVNE